MSTSPEHDSQFLHLADQFMADVLAKLDQFDPDELEGDLSQGVLKMSFADGRKCIMNRQTAAHQIWLAEGAQAWHFAWDDAASRWTDTKGRGDLVQILTDVLSQRLGRRVAL